MTKQSRLDKPLSWNGANSTHSLSLAVAVVYVAEPQGDGTWDPDLSADSLVSLLHALRVERGIRFPAENFCLIKLVESLSFPHSFLPSIPPGDMTLLSAQNVNWQIPQCYRLLTHPPLLPSHLMSETSFLRCYCKSQVWWRVLCMYVGEVLRVGGLPITLVYPSAAQLLELFCSLYLLLYSIFVGFQEVHSCLKNKKSREKNNVTL